MSGAPGRWRNFVDQIPFVTGVKLASGVNKAAGQAAIRKVLTPYPNIEVRTQAEYKADRAETIGQIAQDLMEKGDTASIPALKKALRAMEEANLETKVTAPVREALDTLREKLAAK